MSEKRQFADFCVTLSGSNLMKRMVRMVSIGVSHLRYDEWLHCIHTEKYRQLYNLSIWRKIYVLLADRFYITMCKHHRMIWMQLHIDKWFLSSLPVSTSRTFTTDIEGSTTQPLWGKKHVFANVEREEFVSSKLEVSVWSYGQAGSSQCLGKNKGIIPFNEQLSMLT